MGRPAPSRTPTVPAPPIPLLTKRQLDFVRQHLRKHTGIQLSEQKEAMVATRLSKRLAAAGCRTFDEYIEVLEKTESGGELTEFINCLTTNKTSFFREPQHFDVLHQHLVDLRGRRDRKVRIWSAACSFGAEPYSIAMVAREALGDLRDWDVRILASDVDTSMVERTRRGIYSEAELEGLSRARREWLRPLGDGRFEMVKELRDLVVPRVINFIERPWPIHTTFDVIFCRNVMIYFERDVQRGIYEEQARLLAPDGIYISGHSENLHWLGPLFTAVGPTVHRRGPAAAEGRRAPSAGVVPETVRRIQAGEVHASRDAVPVQTVLGSCVAACLYDPVAKVGGMNHFMLPDETSAEASPDRSVARFGIHAMELLINELTRLGADRRRLVAKAFGASQVLDGVSARIGEQNERFLRRFLEVEQIPLVGERLGGNDPLLVRFVPAEGRAFVRAVPQARAEVDTTERSLRKKLPLPPAPPPTLF